MDHAKKRPDRSIYPAVWRVVICLVVAATLWLTPVAAQELATVSSCPGQPQIPVVFQIDCSHIRDAATKQACRPFIHNQACRVFPIYRKITGIHLEDTCPSIKFSIYEEDNWPHPNGEGGLALKCRVDYLSKYSLKAGTDSKIGPYDVHEILHEYQLALGALPDAHVLFSSSMAEARREIGDTEQYERIMKNMKAEAQRLRADLGNGKIKEADQCKVARVALEESLYLEDSRNASLFYLKLPADKSKTQADREARFSRMFYVVSGAKPEVKQFLMDHRCAGF
jgi:hypothetical protein